MDFAAPPASDWEALFGIPDTETVSCGIYVKSGDEGDFAIVHSLDIPRSQKTMRSGAFSVRATALILALRTGIQLGTVAFGNTLITELLSGTFPEPNSVLVSTTRVPDFEALGYKAAGSGYQFTGKLSQIYRAVHENSVQHTASYSTGEVLSSLLTSKSQDFFTSYGPMGVHPESLFILIFTIEPQPQPVYSFATSSLHPSSDLRRTLSLSSFRTEHSSSSGIGDHDRGSREPSFSSDLGDISTWNSSISIPTEHFATPIASDEPNPASQDAQSNSSSKSSGSSRTRTSHPSATRTRAGSLTTQNTIIQLLGALSPPLGEASFTEAKFIDAASTPLVKLVRNFTAMQTVLTALGLDVSTSHKEFTDNANQKHQLSGQSVLEACGWASKTFINKASIYSNAAKVAKLDWKGPVPDNEKSPEGKLHAAWVGAVFMWSAVGPIVTGTLPDANSEQPGERQGAKLTQSEVEKIGKATARDNDSSALG
ncbi:hypothetical protein DFH06DRAFT_1438752 [Mycena polygramma]|nr:hypothetical protein DFH06DRAFT_1438752 [Mycena polygramma]